MSAYKISILIRNLNEAKALTQCLRSIRNQVTTAAIEIVVLDNESTDNSVKIATSFGCKVYTLKRSLFTYGRALNVGISYCTGEYVFVLSSHVLLLTTHFIEDMLPFLTDKKVAGIRFLNITASEIIENAESVDTITQDVINTAANHTEYWAKLLVCSCSVIQKSCWEMIPFDETIIANEDKKWSIQILEKGFTIIANVPCYFLYHKSMTELQRINKALDCVVTMHQIMGLKKPGVAQLIVSIIRSFLGNLKKFFTSTYYSTLNHIKVYSALRKTKISKQ